MSSAGSWKQHAECIPLNHSYPEPSYFRNDQNEEYIIFMADSKETIAIMAYDVAHDKYSCLVKQFPFALNNQKFWHRPHLGYQSFVIDHENALLYSYDGRCANRSVGSLCCFDLRNECKAIKEKRIDSKDGNEFERFSFLYKMRVIGKHIHFVLGRNEPCHWIYDMEQDTLNLFQQGIDRAKQENYDGAVIYSELHKSLFIFGGKTANPNHYDHIYQLRVNASPHKDELLVLGFTKQTNIAQDRCIPDGVHQIILQYFLIPSDTKWNKLKTKLPRPLANFGCVLMHNQNEVLLFGGVFRRKYDFRHGYSVLPEHEYLSDRIYKFDIAKNEISELSVKCPTHLQCYAVYCPLSQTVHLFEWSWYSRINKRHWSIRVDQIY